MTSASELLKKLGEKAGRRPWVVYGHEPHISLADDCGLVAQYLSESNAALAALAVNHCEMLAKALEAQVCHGVFDPDPQRYVACEPHLRCTRCGALAAVAAAAQEAAQGVEMP